MKNKLIGGLLGILVGIGGCTGYIENSKNGFRLPEKYNSVKEIERAHKKIGNNLIGTWVDYKHEDGSGYREVLMNNKTWWYVVFPEKHDDYTAVYGIADNDCDGIFETKYHNKKAVKEVISIPPCYYKLNGGI